MRAATKSFLEDLIAHILKEEYFCSEGDAFLERKKQLKVAAGVLDSQRGLPEQQKTDFERELRRAFKRNGQQGLADRLAVLLKEFSNVSDTVWADRCKVLKILSTLSGTKPPPLSIEPSSFRPRSADMQQRSGPGSRPQANGHQVPREASGSHPVIRALLAACSGIRQWPVQYDEGDPDCEYAIDAGARLTAPEETLCLKCCEFGRLYRKLQRHVKADAGERLDTSSQSAMQAAFRGALSLKLMAALRLLAHQQGLAQNGVPCGAGQQPLDLIDLYVDLQPMMETLWWLNVAAEAVAHQKGGPALGRLHALSQHGDPAVHTLMTDLLRHASQPLLRGLNAWVFEGDLQAAPGDLFICLSPKPTGALYSERYQMMDSLRPSFISPQLADTVMRAGKSLIFLRECCGAGEWAAACEASPEAQQAASLSVDQEDEMEQVYMAAAARVDEHLIKLLTHEYKYRDYLSAFKRYLLLSQGDFAFVLLEEMAPQLEKRGAELSRYVLEGILANAVRASGAHFDDPDLLDRLHVKLSPSHAHERGGEIGWELFRLDFDLPEPLATLMPSETEREYSRLQHLLWAINRAQHALSTVWRHFHTCQRLISSMRRKSRESGMTPPGLDRVEGALKQAQVLRAAMAGFLTSLQTYIKVEVVETAWDGFCQTLDRVRNLDELIAAHHSYVAGMVKQALLDNHAVLDAVGSLMADMMVLVKPASVIKSVVEQGSQELTTKWRIQCANTARNQWAGNDAGKVLTDLNKQPLMDAVANVGNLTESFTQKEALLEAKLPQDMDLRFLLFRLQVRREGGTATPSRSVTPLSTPRQHVTVR